MTPINTSPMHAALESMHDGSPEPAMSKRSASDAELDSADGRVTRKRASKACLSCRNRKVRCSVSDHGVPCYNCSLDQVDCVVPERKKPTRSHKREKSLGTLLSEAIMHSESHSSPVKGPHSGQSDAGGMQHEEFRSSVRSTSESCHLGSEVSSLGDGPDMAELPRCDEELARWLGVIPPRILDKMFNYLQGFSDNESPYIPARKLPQRRQKSPNKAHLVSSRRGCAGGLDGVTTDVAGHVFTHRQARVFRNHQTPSRPLSPNLPMRDTPPQLADAQCLYQLRQSYISATATLRALETALRKAGDQLSGRHEKQASCFSTPPCGPQAFDLGSTVALTPPPEKSPTCKLGNSVIGGRVVSSQLYSNPQHFSGDESLKLRDADATLSTPEASHAEISEPSEMDDLEGAFDCLVDFGVRDTLFESSLFGSTIEAMSTP